MIVKMLTHIHMVVYTWCGTFTKEKELELKRINSVKKQRRKEVTVSDRTLASVGPARLVSDNSWVWSWSNDWTLHYKGDRTCRACVRSCVTYGDVGDARVGA